MVPSRWVWIDKLPLTTSGKIDRRLLPQPDEVSPGWRPENRTLTPLEQVLTNLWLTVLQLDSISLDDNFFALGGDSIRAIQITSRGRDAGVVVTPRQLFDYPSIRQLAAVLSARQANEILKTSERTEATDRESQTTLQASDVLQTAQTAL
jgi:microcystin synthetase protein McyA